MKITCSWWSFRDEFEKRTLDLFSFLALAAELGFDGIEAGASAFPSVSQRFLRELRGTVRVSPVDIAAITLSNHFACPEASEREEQCEDIIAWTFVCRELSVPVLCTSTGELREGTDEREARGWVYQCYEKILGAAERAGVTLAVAPGRGERRLLRSCAELAEMVMHFGSDCLQLSVDPRDFLVDFPVLGGESRRGSRTNSKFQEPSSKQVPKSKFQESSKQQIRGVEAGSATGATYASLDRVARLAVHSRLEVVDVHGTAAKDARAGLDLARVVQVLREACYDRTVSLEYLGDGDAR
jgi:hypothetical protein